MPKYLFEGSYTVHGLTGVVKEGGSSRRESVEKLAKSMGGSLDFFFFGFGGDDYHIVLDLPDNAAAAAIAMTVTDSGAVTNRTTVLMTPEEVDEAVKKHPKYRAPGE